MYRTIVIAFSTLDGVVEDPDVSYKTASSTLLGKYMSSSSCGPEPVLATTRFSERPQTVNHGPRQTPGGLATPAA